MPRQVFDQPDAGPWELRTTASIHTFSAIMCWAACDRLAKIAPVVGRADRVDRWRTAADRLREIILKRAWNEKRKALASTFDGHDLDASLLLVEPLGFLKADDPRFRMTVEAIGEDLKRGDFLFRYVVADDFGQPETAFTICTFWYIDALVSLGRREEKRARLFESCWRGATSTACCRRTSTTATGELWGNYPADLFPGRAHQLRDEAQRSWEVAS